MKKIIQLIMTDLSALRPPFNPVEIKSIFAKHPNLDSSKSPPSLQLQITKLVHLKSLIDQSFSLAGKKHGLGLNQQLLSELNKKNELFSQEIEENQIKTEQKIALVNDSFANLMPLINERLQKLNLLIPNYTATVDIRTKKLAIEEHQAYLQNKIENIEINNAKLTLLELKNQISGLVVELNSLGVVCSDGDVLARFPAMVFSSTQALNQLTALKSKLNELIQQFAKHLSAVDIHKKSEELNQQITSVENSIEHVNLEISINVLSPPKKHQLSEEYKASSRKSELIKTYQNKVDGFLSYVDIGAWGTWLHEPRKYNTEQIEMSHSVAYLLLLEKADNLTLQKSRLLEQKKAIESLEKPPGNSLEDGANFKNLLLQMKQLFNEYPMLVSPQNLVSGTSNADFYLVLLSNVPEIEKKLEDLNSIEHKVHQLSSVVMQLNNLLLRFKLELKDTHHLSKIDLEKQAELLVNETLSKAGLYQQLDLCKSFLDQVFEVEQLQKHYELLIESKKENESKIELVKLEDTQHELDSLNEQLSLLHEEIAFVVQNISSLPLPDSTPDVELISEPVKLQAISATPIVQDPTAQFTSDIQQPVTTDPEITFPALQLTSEMPEVVLPKVKPDEKITGIAANEELTQPSSLFDSGINPSLKIKEQYPLPVNPVIDGPKEPEPDTLVSTLGLLNETPLIVASPVELTPIPEKQDSQSDLTLSPTSEYTKTKTIIQNSQNLELSNTLEAPPLENPPQSIGIHNSGQIVLSEHHEQELSETVTILPQDPPTEQTPIPVADDPSLSSTPELSTKPVSDIKEREEVAPIGLELTQENNQPQHSVDIKEPVPEKFPSSKPLHAERSETLIEDTSIVVKEMKTSVELIQSTAMPEHLSAQIQGEYTSPHQHEKNLDPVSLPVNQYIGSVTPPQDQSDSGEHQKLGANQLFAPDLLFQKPFDTIASAIPATTEPPIHIYEPVEEIIIPDDLTLNLTPNSPVDSMELDKQLWHKQILGFLKQHPQDIQEWYLNVHNSLEIYSAKESSSLKPLYLLRDILFELQRKNDVDVIRAYMRLCPNPQSDINSLLAIKPEVPLVTDPFDEEKELQDAPGEFMPLYNQYVKLKKDHPVEGELLLQAIQTLRMAKIFKDLPNSSITTTDIPSLAQDPRFDPLKRHRGFLRVWEALEDLWNLIVGKIRGLAQHQYAKKPCFFKTKSAQLVEEADLMIQKDLLPIIIV